MIVQRNHEELMKRENGIIGSTFIELNQDTIKNNNK